MADASPLDRRFLAAAIRLGGSARGRTWPNPAVGAIVVKDGKVVGRGRTGTGGKPHGEPQALAQAGAAARGATLYVSLEPCDHFGKTPPCTDAILAAGIARVVAASGDPDPRVAGRGFARLREAGMEVVSGVMTDEADRVQAGHLSRMRRGRPLVTLKLAVSADDAIGREGEGNVAVTAPIARRHVQALRSRFDAILVGRGTIEADDPALTCRLPGLEHRSPIRVILDGRGLDPSRRVFETGPPTWVFGDEEGGEDPVRWMKAARGADGRLNLTAVLGRLAAEGITRLLVEGGARVARSFLETDLVDEVLLFRSPVLLGVKLVPALAGLPLSAIERSDRFRRGERRMFGPDQLTRYERV
jgi:diaminohydroxyphosphoribosylaminopyrimidine deaminase/5-amino-6-(5-phosphoribosylamino)uracil reductase